MVKKERGEERVFISWSRNVNSQNINHPPTHAHTYALTHAGTHA